MVYGKRSYLGLWKQVREARRLRAGDRLEVTLERDDAPRTVTPPKELAAALKRDAVARAGWKAMSFTHQREWAEAIRDAKKPETRERRVAQAVAALVKKGGARRRSRAT
jgi:uncharacterized protein YdeI (YjbR/CyaY-like superfamily)